MKRCLPWLMVAGLVAGLSCLTACEWGSGGDTGFNTSQGAGVSVNFSGVYKGLLGGGVIDQTSGGPIGQLVIQQSGNAVEVTDDHGSKYRGSIGSPGAVSDKGATGTYPAGAELVQAQINFTGHDNVANKTINFAGVIHAIAVTDIQGTKTVDESVDKSGSSSSTSSDDSGSAITKTTANNGTNTVITIVDASVPGTIVTTTITLDNKTNQEISRTVTTQAKSGTTASSDNTVTTTATTEYQLTEANTQYRLQGTWAEEGGKVANLDALSPGTSGVITSTTTTSGTTTTTP